MLTQIVAAVVASTTLSLINVSAAAEALPVGCAGQDVAFCWVEVSDEIKVEDGEPLNVVVPPASDGAPDPCVYELVVPQPPPDDPVWAGHDPSTGSIWRALCPEVLSKVRFDDSGANEVTGLGQSDPYFVGDGDSPDEHPVQVDPRVLVERARAVIDLPVPQPVFGPDAEQIAVKVPVWLSVPAFGAVTQSASAGRFTATVTAELVDTVWEMGEPRDVAVPYLLAPPVVCAGAGVSFAAGMNPGAPPCGYTYIWRSLRERTGGAGAWPVTVTSRYRFTWEVTGPTGVVDSGTQMDERTETTTTTQLRVREWRTQLVDTLPGG